MSHFITLIAKSSYTLRLVCVGELDEHLLSGSSGKLSQGTEGGLVRGQGSSAGPDIDPARMPWCRRMTHSLAAGRGPSPAWVCIRLCVSGGVRTRRGFFHPTRVCVCACV